MKLNVTMKDLLEAGVHFGHQVSKWNPKMRPFIFTERAGVHVVDLGLTLQKLEQACDFLAEVTEEGKSIIFVGTKRQAAPAIEKYAQSCRAFYLSNRWVGGLLTNFATVLQSIKNYEKMEQVESDKKEFSVLTTKEKYQLKKEIARKRKLFGGLKGLSELPGALFIVDPKKEECAVREAQRMGVPLVALLDTNGDPTQINYPIPGNDDALRSIELIVGTVAECIKKSKNQKAKRKDRYVHISRSNQKTS